ncbi:MAG: microcin C ABC transporter permease YejB, partial [Proteobacteria bacterium]|nr:microcin C ABC transporter permease YejB [Pseudomonadota bacterium]
MYLYILKRILLIIPTLFFIMLINFLIIQTAPGGPVERLIAQLNHPNQLTGEVAVSPMMGGSSYQGDVNAQSNNAALKYRGSQGIDPEIIAKIEKIYGFDQPLMQRFFNMMKKYLVFDFGDSFYQDKKVVDLVLEKMPVSISLGIWTTLLVYLISIPLGIKKAVRDGSKFDIWTSSVIVVGYAIPSFLFAILLIVLFAGGNFFDLFPLRGLVSDNFAELSWYGKITDYLWHMCLPILSMVVGGFAGLVFLCKNSFIEEINKQYVLSAKAKGLNENQLLYGHVFRNAMLIVIAGFPAALISILFTGAMLIEIIFSLDGLGLLGFESAISRDYPVMFGTLYFFTLLGLLMSIIGDLTYRLVD